MNYLLVAAVIGLFLGQSYFGAYIYLVYISAIALIVVSTKSVYVTQSVSYTLGTALVLLSVLLTTVLNAEFGSIQYLVLMLGSIVLYPLFINANIQRNHYKYLIGFLVLTAPPLLFASKPGYHILWGNPNNYASLLVCVSYCLLLPTGRKFWLQTLIMGSTFYLIYLTKGRSVLAAYTVFIALFITQKYILRTVFRLRLALILAALVFAYITLITDDRFQLLAAIQDANIGDKGYNGLSFRDTLFYAAIEIIGEHPLGVGMGQAGDYIEEKVGIGLSPHNAFLKMTVEGGLGLLAGYLIVLAGAIRRLRSPLAGSVCVALFIRCLFESATPFTGSIVSAMLLLPFFFNEYSLHPEYRGERGGSVPDEPSRTLAEQPPTAGLNLGMAGGQSAA